MKKVTVIHQGWGGHHCWFCNKVIGRSGYVTLNIFEKGISIDGYNAEAHVSCAKKYGLIKMGDRIEVDIDE
jgi:hypothetical protein